MLKWIKDYNNPIFNIDLPIIDESEITVSPPNVDSLTICFDSKINNGRYHLWIPETNEIFPNCKFPKNFKKIPTWIFEVRFFIYIFMKTFDIFTIN